MDRAARFGRWHPRRGHGRRAPEAVQQQARVNDRPAGTPVLQSHDSGDKGYDVRGFVADARKLGVTPHVAQNNTSQRSAIDGRTTRHPDMR